jgi:hypothetical protein
MRTDLNTESRTTIANALILDLVVDRETAGQYRLIPACAKASGGNFAEMRHDAF